MTDLILVTAHNFPTIFKAFELISHDSGRQAGHRNYGVPLDYAEALPRIDASLQHLWENADSDFECLCTGERTEAEKIVADYKLGEADELLQQFFSEFR